MKEIGTSLLIFLSLLSCSKNKTGIDEIFEQKISLEHKKKINENNYLIGSSGKMLIIDSLLITIDYSNEHLFHIFDIKNNQYLSNSGVKGQGPNEFLHPSSLIYFSPDYFLTYDLLDNSLKKVRIDSLLLGNVLYDKLITFNSISNLSVVPTKHRNYVAFGLYESNMFKLIDEQGEDVGMFMDFPIEKDKAKSNIDNRNIGLAYQGIININSDKDKIVYASFYSTILGIYNINTTSIDLNYLFAYDYPQYISQNNDKGMSSPITKEGISAFRDVFDTDKYIYTLYSGKKISESKEAAFEARDIYVFDWEGNSIAHYILDVPINNIAVLPNNSKIYALANLPEPTLIEFDINL